MYLEKLKFGFLTTYNETIFLRQDVHPVTGKWMLWHSNVIHHTTASEDVQGDNPENYFGKVSVRECFVYLAMMVDSGNYRADNPMDDAKWYGQRGGAYTDRDYTIYHHQWMVHRNQPIAACP